MKSGTATLMVAFLIGFLLATRATAQIFTPTFMAPRASSDVGIYLSDTPGEFAVEGIWRRNFGGYDLGLRAGVADTEDVSVLIGGELRNPLPTGAPVDLALTAAVQAMLGDLEEVGLMLGLSAGHTFGTGGIALTPYLHPRLAFINGREPDDDFDLELLADLGLDLLISPRLELRFGIGLDDDSPDLGVGFAWR